MRRCLNGETLLIQQDPDHPTSELSPFGDTSHRCRSLMYAPVRTPSGVIGVISVQSYSKSFTESDLHLLERVAETMAPALERARAEQLVRASEERYRTLVETAPMGILLISDFAIRYANPAAIRMLGANSEADLLELPIDRFLHSSMREVFRERLSDVLTQGRGTPAVELDLMRLDGQRIVVESQESPTDYQGRPAALIVLNDITERKRALAKLQESEQQLKLLFDQTPLGVHPLEPRLQSCGLESGSNTDFRIQTGRSAGAPRTRVDCSPLSPFPRGTSVGSIAASERWRSLPKRKCD
ncbi:MAG: hypothetical protein KatS3mg130_1889 [Candidatus Sumerlaea sp.]|nr:MAG: hypothetical protein KatS3mg130_1889 [Candidatus Sumerlaea sp.]